jgi:hypothetical protein
MRMRCRLQRRTKLAASRANSKFVFLFPFFDVCFSQSGRKEGRKEGRKQFVSFSWIYSRSFDVVYRQRCFHFISVHACGGSNNESSGKLTCITFMKDELPWTLAQSLRQHVDCSCSCLLTKLSWHLTLAFARQPRVLT